MKRMMLVLALTIVAACASATAQSTANGEWVGIWNAHVDGQPAGTLTLATDMGELGGTVVLDMVSDEGGTPHVIEREPHVLMHPHVHGNTLSFQVRMKKPDGSVVLPNFTVTLTSPGKANFHCVNCGADAPVVELVKGQ